ncbi:MAG: TRAP transporter large permease subunit [Christensenellales bacterium]
MTTATLAAIAADRRLYRAVGDLADALCRCPFAMLLSPRWAARWSRAPNSLRACPPDMVDGVNNFSLLSIPFFILMGEIMGAGGISDKIIDLANLAVGRFRGGLAYVNCLSSMFFGGISGSAVGGQYALFPRLRRQHR